MKSKRTKIIVGIVAVLTASSLFAFKGKMMHHKKAKTEDCRKMRPVDGDMKSQYHQGHFRFNSKKDLGDK